MGSAGYDNKKRNNKKEKENENETPKKPIYDEELEKLYDSIPKNQYLCPYCGAIPELINIFTDNGCIEFKCQCKGELPFKVDDYFKELSESKYTYVPIAVEFKKILEKKNKNLSIVICAKKIIVLIV